MNLLEILTKRANSKCELCSSDSMLDVYKIPPKIKLSEETAVLLCNTCVEQIEGIKSLDVNHWHCLYESIWSDLAGIKVLCFRLLKRISNEMWARDLLEQLDIDASGLEWARAGIENEEPEDLTLPTLDSNGVRLADGDSVTIIKDLNVKGAGFTAKRGTLVKGISLTSDPKHIEGKVNGVQIVLVAAYLKKA